MTKKRHLKKGLIWVTIIASLGLCIVVCSYFMKFTGVLSSNQSDWGVFGDFIGGTLNPIFSFLSLLAILFTINLQVQELEATRTELKQSRIAQEKQSENFGRQLDGLDKKNRRDLTFHMLDRWTSSIMRTHRLKAWNYLVRQYPSIDQEHTKINIYQFSKDDNQSFESFSEVCQFMSDLNKLINQSLVDVDLCKILFSDSLLPWFVFVDNLAFDRYEDILGKVYNENVESWYKNKVMTLKENLN